jgi:hypothetical protein
VYIGKPSFDTLAAFFTGYSVACSMRGVAPPFWDDLLAEIHVALAPELADSALALDGVLRHVTEGDMKRGYRLLVEEIRNRLPAE